MTDPFSHSAPYIKFRDCRNTVQVTLLNYVPPCEARIDKVNDDFYYVRSTHELRLYNKTATVRGDNKRSIRRAFNNIKAIINCNYESPENVRFLTLTYAENMTVKERIPKDAHRFFRRLRGAYGSFEYLYCKERQGRGAWHLHVVVFFDHRAPYMENEDVAAMWGHGFVNVQGFSDDINNLGNYLCAYLTDDKDTGKKGARLLNYEAGVRLYNCSKGIARPIERTMSYDEYMELRSDKGIKEVSARESNLTLDTGRTLTVRYELHRKVF